MAAGPTVRKGRLREGPGGGGGSLSQLGTARHHPKHRSPCFTRRGSLLPTRGPHPALPSLRPPPAGTGATASALLRALAGLHHGVAPLAQGELPAEEGRGALRFHRSDLLTCRGARTALRTGLPGEAQPPGAWSGLSSPLHTCPLSDLTLPPNSPTVTGGGWACHQPQPEANQCLSLMLGQPWCRGAFAKTYSRTDQRNKVPEPIGRLKVSSARQKDAYKFPVSSR